MLRNTVLLSALAYAAGAGFNANTLTVESQGREPQWNLRTLRSNGPTLYGTKGAGITMAQQKRAAKKRKNRARHKLAMKRR